VLGIANVHSEVRLDIIVGEEVHKEHLNLVALWMQQDVQWVSLIDVVRQDDCLNGWPVTVFSRTLTVEPVLHLVWPRQFFNCRRSDISLSILGFDILEEKIDCRRAETAAIPFVEPHARTMIIHEQVLFH
jgi:hypothetical protein